jgi:OmpA-OmpF porin, OOP family
MSVPALLATALVCCTPALAQPDRPGSQDHPLLTRMQDMRIANYRANPFDRFAFRIGRARNQDQVVEGRFYEIRYQTREGAAAPSPLAIIRNFQQAIRGVGGTVLFEDQRYTTLKAARNGQEFWIQVDTAWGRGYQLTIVEKGDLAQEVVANAAAFKAGLVASGHVELPGLYFESGKAVLHARSWPSIAEMANYLKSEPGQKVFIVGHTDAQAAVEANLKLSQARAEAVVEALVTRHGIEPARLRAFGAGPFAPIASNATEEGRARNRRVELVKN